MSSIPIKLGAGTQSACSTASTTASRFKQSSPNASQPWSGVRLRNRNPNTMPGVSAFSCSAKGRRRVSGLAVIDGQPIVANSARTRKSPRR